MMQLSWSALRRWEECRALDNFVMTRKVKDSPFQNRLYIPGTIADRMMRRYLELPDDQQVAGWMVDNIDDVFEEFAITRAQEEEGEQIQWRSPADKWVLRNELKENMPRLEALIREHILTTEYTPEWVFRAEIVIPYLDGNPTKVKLAGGADVVTRKPVDLYDIWDLKWTKNKDYWKKTLGQLTFYDIAAEAILGVKPQAHAFIQPLVLEEPIKRIVVTDDQRAAMWQRIIKMAHGRWSKDHAPKDGSAGCTSCQAYAICPKFRLSITELNGRKTVRL